MPILETEAYENLGGNSWPSHPRYSKDATKTAGGDLNRDQVRIYGTNKTIWQHNYLLIFVHCRNLHFPVKRMGQAQ